MNQFEIPEGFNAMYFLETIAGLKGENLATAVFKYLLINSSAVRLWLVEAITEKVAPSELPSFKNGITCETEVETDDGGRIDLLVDCDNVIIGIENKLWAEIQKDQPGKYLKSLKARAAGTSRSKTVLLLVLAPSERRREIQAEIKRQQLTVPVLVLFWQDILRNLKELADESSSNRLIAEFLIEYLEQFLGPLKIPKHFVLGDGPLGNQYQYNLLTKLQSLVNDADGFTTRKIAPGKTFIGFGFDFRCNNITHQRWLGFIKDEAQTDFCIQAGEADDNVNIPGTMRDSEIWKYGTVYKFDFDRWPETLADWRDFLQPTIDAIVMNAESKDNPIHQ